MIEIIFAALILFIALYVLLKNIRETGKGEGCSNCDGCSGGCNIKPGAKNSGGIEILKNKAKKTNISSNKNK